MSVTYLLKCPDCGSKSVKKTWEWMRVENGTVGSGDSAIDYDQFKSRSVGFKCNDCGRKFTRYYKKVRG